MKWNITQENILKCNRNTGLTNVLNVLKNATHIKATWWTHQWYGRSEKEGRGVWWIVNAVDESANSYELVARIKLEVLKYQKLERGSDVES